LSARALSGSLGGALFACALSGSLGIALSLCAISAAGGASGELSAAGWAPDSGSGPGCEPGEDCGADS
jgi:hypothetical protein